MDQEMDREMDRETDRSLWFWYQHNESNLVHWHSTYLNLSSLAPSFPHGHQQQPASTPHFDDVSCCSLE